MTSHPKDAGIRLFAAMAESEKAARHIHLPFQAGSDRILAAMNRRYTKEEYLEKVELARSCMPTQTPRKGAPLSRTASVMVWPIDSSPRGRREPLRHQTLMQ